MDGSDSGFTRREYAYPHLSNLGVKLVFDQLPGGEVKESIKSAQGTVTSTKTLGSQVWQETTKAMQSIK
jgi:hypothetical protein